MGDKTFNPLLILEYIEKLNNLQIFNIFVWFVFNFALFVYMFRHKTYIRSLFLFILSTIALIYFNFYNNKNIPYTANIPIEKQKNIKCYHDGEPCELNTDKHYIRYSYFGKDSNKPLICSYNDITKTFFPPADHDKTLSIDTMFCTINNLKISQNNKDFNASFNLENPITNKMITSNQKELNISICEKPCRAHLNLDSTYITHQKWPEVEKIIRSNCDKNISIKQSINGDDIEKEFDISLPPSDVKNVHMQENRYIFTGETKQSQFPIVANKKNFEAVIDIQFLQKSACFVLGIDDNNTLKIENGVVSLNQIKVPDSITLEPTDNVVHLIIQPKGNGIHIQVQGQDDIVAQTQIHTIMKNKFFIGSMIKFKSKKDLLSVAVNLNEIRGK